MNPRKAHFLRSASVVPIFALVLCAFSTWAAERQPGITCDLILTTKPITVKEATQMAFSSLKRHAAHVKFDEFDMVVPNKSAGTLEKIAKDMGDLKARVTEAAAKGQHVLFLSGSFDLIHKGHALFVTFSIDSYLKRHGITRDQLYVVATADGDDLLAVGKASKYIGNGGKEPFMRPVQRAGRFESVAHPRALDLATLPVDAVLMTPSPREISETLFAEDDFQLATQELLNEFEGRIAEFLNRIKNDPEKYRQAVQDIKAFEPQIRTMARLILQDMGHLIVEEFASSVDVEKAKSSAVWNLTSWNFLLYHYLNASASSLDKFSRVLNAVDADYLSVVATMQNLTGMSVLLMPEEKSMSTTDLLKAHGEETLVEAKKRAHTK